MDEFWIQLKLKILVQNAFNPVPVLIIFVSQT